MNSNRDKNRELKCLFFSLFMERIEGKSRDSRKLRSLLVSLFTSLKKSVHPSHSHSEGDERNALANYFFRMQIYRQHDEAEHCKKAANRTSKAKRSQSAACAVRPWYKDNHFQQDHLPQLRQRKSRRDRNKALLVAPSSLMHRYRALKKRVKPPNIRKRLTISSTETVNIEDNRSQHYTYDKDEAKHIDNKSF